MPRFLCRGGVSPPAPHPPAHAAGDNPSVTLARATLSLRLGHLAVLTVPRTVIHYRSAASLPFAQGRHGNLQAKEISTFSQGENISHLQSKYFTRPMDEFHSPKVNFTAGLQGQARIEAHPLPHPTFVSSHVLARREHFTFAKQIFHSSYGRLSLTAGEFHCVLAGARCAPHGSSRAPTPTNEASTPYSPKARVTAT